MEKGRFGFIGFSLPIKKAASQGDFSKLDKVFLVNTSCD
jgi:hypothetical protein